MIELTNGWKLSLIPIGRTSPMAGHLGGEIAVDDAARTMYGWELFAAVYGVDSIKDACHRYIAAVQS